MSTMNVPIGKWVPITGSGKSLMAIKPDTQTNGRFVKAFGSTVETGTYCVKSGTNQAEFQITWGMSLLGKTQRRIYNENIPPTDRVREFVLDLVGAIGYSRARPKRYPKKK